MSVRSGEFNDDAKSFIEAWSSDTNSFHARNSRSPIKTIKPVERMNRLAIQRCLTARGRAGSVASSVDTEFSTTSTSIPTTNQSQTSPQINRRFCSLACGRDAFERHRSNKGSPTSFAKRAARRPGAQDLMNANLLSHAQMQLSKVEPDKRLGTIRTRARLTQLPLDYRKRLWRLES